MLVLHYLVLFFLENGVLVFKTMGIIAMVLLVTGIALTSLRGKMKENRMIQNLRKQC